MIYKVMLQFNGHVTYEVEAHNEEYAEDKALDMLHEEASGFAFIETTDAVVTKSDNQYSDSQELEDGERRHEDKG